MSYMKLIDSIHGISMYDCGTHYAIRSTVRKRVAPGRYIYTGVHTGSERYIRDLWERKVKLAFSKTTSI